MRAYPPASHLAEKLHALTQPRPRPSGCVKDLVDMAPLSTAPGLDAATIRDAIRQTFGFLGSHLVPAALPDPPDSQRAAYAPAHAEDGLPWATVDDVFAAAHRLPDPVLAGTDGRWDPMRRSRVVPGP